MNRRYTPEEKAQALKILDACKGNVLVTSVETGISERTLFRWKSQRNKNNLQKITVKPPIPTAEILKDQEEMPMNPNMRSAEYQDLRDQIMGYIKNIIADVGPDNLIEGNNAIAITRLLDRLYKLDQWIDILKTQETTEDNKLAIVYINPDTKEEQDHPYYWTPDPNNPRPYSPFWRDNLPPEEQDKPHPISDIPPPNNDHSIIEDD